MKEHYLKTDTKYFKDIRAGIKPFEVRYNDRDYQVGDVLILEETIGRALTLTYTGQIERRTVGYILDNPDYCKEGYVVMGFADTALRAAQEREKPLTLEEMRNMGGEPVYFVKLDENGNVLRKEWRILDVRGEGHQFFRGDTQGEWLEDYGKTWNAYRSRPKEGAEHETN